MTLSGGPEGAIYNRSVDAGPPGNEVDTRSVFGRIRYQFTDKLTGFAQLIYGVAESAFKRMRGDYYLAGGQHATVFRDNAFLPEHIGLAMDEAGIDSFQLHKSGSFVGNIDAGEGSRVGSEFDARSYSIGFDWAIGDNWDLRASCQSGRSSKHPWMKDMIRSDRMFLAADAVRDPETGAIVCRVQLYDPTPEQLAATPGIQGRLTWSGNPLPSPIGLDNSVRDCVPYNIMGAGNMCRATRDYVMTPLCADASVTQDFAEVLASGQISDGWGYGPVRMATGLTYRDQSFRDGAHPRDVTDLGPPINALELGIQGISIRWYDALPTLYQFTLLPTITGGYDVWEWFGELNVPLWATRSENQRFDASLTYRSSDYSSVGRVEAWKVGLDVQLVRSLRLRATQSRDVREATFLERHNRGAGGVIPQDPLFGTPVDVISYRPLPGWYIGACVAEWPSTVSIEQ